MYLKLFLLELTLMLLLISGYLFIDNKNENKITLKLNQQYVLDVINYNLKVIQPFEISNGIYCVGHKERLFKLSNLNDFNKDKTLIQLKNEGFYNTEDYKRFEIQDGVFKNSYSLNGSFDENTQGTCESSILGNNIIKIVPGKNIEIIGELYSGTFNLNSN